MRQKLNGVRARQGDCNSARCPSCAVATSGTSRCVSGKCSVCELQRASYGAATSENATRSARVVPEHVLQHQCKGCARCRSSAPRHLAGRAVADDAIIDGAKLTRSDANANRSPSAGTARPPGATLASYRLFGSPAITRGTATRPGAEQGQRIRSAPPRARAPTAPLPPHLTPRLPADLAASAGTARGSTLRRARCAHLCIRLPRRRPARRP